MENHFDNESYWNRSTSKAFSFDDDDDAAGIGTALNNTLNLNKEQILNDDAYSEANFDNTNVGETFNLSIKTIISDKALKIILQEQSLESQVVSKGISSEEELKLLRRQIQTTLYNPSPETTAQKLLLSKNVLLEVFKSLHDKEQLLDIVFKNGGGDAVIGVLLFLRKSLNRQIFHKILQERPKALRHYISYLKQHKVHEAIELLQLFGHQQEAAVLQFKLIAICNDLQVRKRKLQQLLERYNSYMGVINSYQQAFQSSLKLIETIERENMTIGDTTNLNSTPIEVLYALLCKCKNWKDQDLAPQSVPILLSNEQHISAAQFDWCVLNERASAGAYADLDIIFKRASAWPALIQKQFHINISLETAVFRLYELQAPTAVLYLFLSKISNSYDKLELAQRVKCPKAIIDAYAALKDINQLLQLKSKLPERSEEQLYCESIVKGLQNKRWASGSIKIKLLE